MPTTVELKTRREALAASRSSGVARVSYDGRSVDYRSITEIDRAIEVLDREIATAEGRKIIRQVRVITTKGLQRIGWLNAFRRRGTGGPLVVRARLEGAMSQRRLRGWQPPLENINSLVASGGPRLLARSRELVVTNGYAANACEAFASNLVGDGIKAGIVSRRKVVEATGCDVEEIDRENATDAARVAALGLRYRTSPGETQGARATPTQRPEAAANDATEQE